MLAAATTASLLTALAPGAVAAGLNSPSKTSLHESTMISMPVAGADSLTGQPASSASEDSLINRVERAASYTEVATILDGDGFAVDHARSTSESVMFTKKVGNVTVDYPIYTQATKDRINAESELATARMAVGWNWSKGGPYVKAKPSEWLSIARYGTTGATGLCALITNVFGAAACGVVGNLAAAWIGDQHVPEDADKICVAVSASRNIWIEDC